jgi:hypothetical protein
MIVRELRMGDDMPADPFRDTAPDWTEIAAADFTMYAAHVAAGFTEHQALELTARYLSFVIGVILASTPPQLPPGTPAEDAEK